MKIGILILFHNDEKQIKMPQLIRLFTKKLNINICFLNNGSTDNTLEILKEIKEESTIPISIVDVKKHKSNHAAIKTGFRYLSNKKEFSNILCLRYYNIPDFGFLEKAFQLMQ